MNQNNNQPINPNDNQNNIAPAPQSHQELAKIKLDQKESTKSSAYNKLYTLKKDKEKNKSRCY
jgi:hypothetical protein